MLFTDNLKMEKEKTDDIRYTQAQIQSYKAGEGGSMNLLTPKRRRTAQLTSRCCILYIYSTNIRTEYFKHAA